MQFKLKSEYKLFKLVTTAPTAFLYVEHTFGCIVRGGGHCIRLQFDLNSVKKPERVVQDR